MVFSGEATPTIFTFAFLLNWGQLLKKRICSCRSKFLSLRVVHISKGFVVQRSKKEVKNCSSVVKLVAGVPIYIKMKI